MRSLQCLVAALELGPSASSSVGLIHRTLLTLLLVFAVSSVRIFHIFETSFCTICATRCDSSLKLNWLAHVSSLTLRTCTLPIVLEACLSFPDRSDACFGVCHGGRSSSDDREAITETERQTKNNSWIIMFNSHIQKSARLGRRGVCLWS